MVTIISSLVPSYKYIPSPSRFNRNKFHTQSRIKLRKLDSNTSLISLSLTPSHQIDNNNVDHRGNRFHGPFLAQSGGHSVHINWKEMAKAHVFKAEPSGLKKEDVKVEVQDSEILQISSELIVDNEQETGTWHCLERCSGKFLRRFRLPDNANLDQIKAAMEHGLLTVTVPKKVKKSGVVSIDISG